MKRVIIGTVLFVVAISCFGQKSEKIYIQREIIKASEKGTRTNAGVTGGNYFVNNADLRIMCI